MAQNERYNGYSNYETWNVCLWINNDEGLYRAYPRNRVRSARSCEEAVRDLMPNGTPDMDGPQDYDKVDWSEVMEALGEDD